MTVCLACHAPISIGKFCDHICRLSYHLSIEEKAQKAVQRETKKAVNILGLEIIP